MNNTTKNITNLTTSKKLGLCIKCNQTWGTNFDCTNCSKKTTRKPKGSVGKQRAYYDCSCCKPIVISI